MKTGLQIMVFWSFFLFALPWCVYRLETFMGGPRFGSSSFRAAGILLFAAASTLGLLSGWVMASRGKGTPLPMDTARELVVSGPYRYVRNPMGMSGLLQGAGVALYLGSPLVLAYVFAGWIILDFIVRPWEERDLVVRFGEPYLEYRRQVRRWRPRLRAYEPRSVRPQPANRNSP